MTTPEPPRPPVPPFDRDGAIRKVRLAEDAWNTRDPARVVPRLHGRQRVAQPRRVPHGPRGDRAVPARASGRANSTTG